MAHPPIACTLSAHALGCEAEQLLPGLARDSASVESVPNGIQLTFAARDGLISRIAAVIERERQCCQFMRFRVEFSPSLGPIVLVIDGPPGTAEFLARLDASLAPPTSSVA